MRIVLRADSGFAREALMAWCEAHGVDYLFGLARNARLVSEIEAELAEASLESVASGRPARRFKDFLWTTRKSWSRRRRVVGKAEWTRGEANPRFVVTSLSRKETEARYLYEKIYCARGEMENRIKECQLDLYADRTSTATMRANQLRLWFASFAYVLICAVRRVGLAHTQFAEATCGTIRLKLLKLAGLVRISARRIKFALASASPYANEWRLAAARLVGHRPRRAPDVFADRDPHPHAADLVELERFGPGREVAHLVEHAVVGQQALVVAADDLATGGKFVLQLLPLLRQRLIRPKVDMLQIPQQLELKRFKLIGNRGLMRASEFNADEHPSIG